MIVVAVAWANLVESYKAKRIEWLFAAFLMGWGVLLLLPIDTFSTSRSYSVMAWWASEVTWGAWFLLAGTIRLVILIINGVWWRTAFFRALAAFISLFFWASISLSVMLANPSSTGFIYAIVFVFEVSNMRIAAQDAGTLERLELARARLPETGWKGFILYVIGVRGKPDAAAGN